MILGLTDHPAANCFVELDDALSQLTTRTVVLNAHAFPDLIPEGAVVMQTESVPEQIFNTLSYLQERNEVWDISARNAEHYTPTHVVPIGYHPSFERFAPVEPEYDIAFTGCLNTRRAAVLNALAERGLVVAYVGVGMYGAERDAILARSRLAINMLWEPGRIFPSLRVAHLVSNRVPVLSERCVDGWSFVPTCPYEDLVDVAERVVRDGARAQENAAYSLEEFRKMPLVLP